jgi:hypothetical protein
MKEFSYILLTSISVAFLITGCTSEKPIEISISQVYEEARQDFSSAHTKYQGTLVTTEGSVRVAPGADSEVSSMLIISDESRQSIFCSMSMGYTSGSADKVRVQGIVSFLSQGQIILNDCKIVK